MFFPLNKEVAKFGTDSITSFKHPYTSMWKSTTTITKSVYQIGRLDESFSSI